MKKQRLIVLFDGTWNDPEDRTNVYRLARSIHDYDGDIRQKFFYDPGVGTSKWSRFRGGVTGWGLSKNLVQGYEWLVKNYSSGDEIWTFGFSRGAFTARSMVGMIRKCGLLHISTPRLLSQAEDIYRDNSLEPDSKVCEEFRHAYSRIVRIHFIGVWDTVGALGIPGTMLSEKGKYSWHDTELSNIVDRAYHAMALDEHRAIYNVTRWTHETGSKKSRQQSVEQRWFIGAHANVGGGYGDDPLSDISLHWMQEKAGAAGLTMEMYPVDNRAWLTKPCDSFKKFLKGGYAFLRRLHTKGSGRFYRRFATDENGNKAVNITIDPSVWSRWQDTKCDYRPPTLTQADQEPPAK